MPPAVWLPTHPTARVNIRRAGGEFLLNDAGQAIKATTHVGYIGGQPDTGAAVQTDHRCCNSAATSRSTSASGRPLMRMQTCPNSIVRQPVLAELLAAGN